MKNTGKKPLVGIVMGSDSDWDKIRGAAETLAYFGVPFEARVMSAHRTPDAVAGYASAAAGRGIKVLLSAAGGAAHLGGVIASRTTLPVIGIPVAGGALNGMDALLATVQMPSGIPVATVAVGSAGATNAAILAVQILATSSAKYAKKLAAHREKLAQKVSSGNARIQEEAAKIGK